MKERHIEHDLVYDIAYRDLYMKERHIEHYWSWFMILPITICT